MNRFFALVLLVLLAPFARADGPDDAYIGIYAMIQQADALNEKGQTAQAMAQYLAAQSALKKFRAGYPDWNLKIVGYRAEYLASKIAEISTKPVAPAVPPMVPGTNAPMPAGESPVPATTAPPVVMPPVLVETDDSVKSLKDQVGRLGAEKVLLEAKLKEALAAQPAAMDPRELTKAQEQIIELRKANDLLQVSLTEAKAAVPASTDSKGRGTAPKKDDSVRQLAEAQSQAAILKSDRDTLKLENTALENRIKQLAAGGPVATGNASASAEVVTLRARLEALEAQKVPYTPEELALLKTTPAKLPEVVTAPVKRPAKALPPAAATIRGEAQRFFVAHQFDKAEEKYLELLKMDDQNVVILGNLAFIEVELHHLDDAEAHVKQALAIEPNDAYSLKVLGRLKFEQKKLDDSADALSRAAQLDPQNPEIQNYLGMTLDAKGMRGPAETAFRKALQIDPKYGDAHNNLAVAYVTQTPPLVELARWHYEKARSFGSPVNPGLEKLLDAAKTPEGAK